MSVKLSVKSARELVGPVPVARTLQAAILHVHTHPNLRYFHLSQCQSVVALGIVALGILISDPSQGRTLTSSNQENSCSLHRLRLEFLRVCTAVLGRANMLEVYQMSRLQSKLPSIPSRSAPSSSQFVAHQSANQKLQVSMS